ncbi:hypothetical protein D9M70_572090 [compost metagenome]
MLFARQNTYSGLRFVSTRGIEQFGSLLPTEEILVLPVRNFKLYPLASHDLDIIFHWARIK